ncbi:MAG: glutamine synthetase type III, partial [Lawsonibacter sp.]|nr:glutamine synthetase type III [Lawsonibacter sp.]
LCAVIKAVDDYQDLLRISVATAGNDHRLGANEAPPAVVSIFLGDELAAILGCIEHDAPYTSIDTGKVRLGVDVLPKFRRDTTDRNRTSPFAFTGNKFEFRMVGSSDSIACANIMLNTAVAESLRVYADRLEGAEDFESALQAMIRKTIQDHKRIIFNGNGYEEAWIREAEKRGLSNCRTTPDCVARLLDGKNVELLTSHRVFTRAELESRYEVTLENYCKTIIIEANTMVDMARTEIVPAVEACVLDTARAAAAKKELVPGCSCEYEAGLVKRLSALVDQIAVRTAELEETVLALSAIGDIGAEAAAIRDKVLPKMGELRLPCDQAETLTPRKYWPFPTYGDLLFGVR